MTKISCHVYLPPGATGEGRLTGGAAFELTARVLLFVLVVPAALGAGEAAGDVPVVWDNGCAGCGVVDNGLCDDVDCWSGADVCDDSEAGRDAGDLVAPRLGVLLLACRLLLTSS